MHLDKFSIEQKREYGYEPIGNAGPSHNTKAVKHRGKY